jgi:type IV pilus assembly protein PilC
MVRAGEESGSLAESLAIVGQQMEKTYVLKKKVKGAFIYPAIIVTVMIMIGVAMMVFVVPTLTATFEEMEVELPLTTQIVIGTSNVMKDSPLMVALGALIIASLAYLFFRSKKGKEFFDWIFLKIPVIKNITKEVNAARTTRTLSSLLQSGVDMVIALQITKGVIGNHYYKDVIGEAEDVVQKGENLSHVFEKYDKYYPSFVSEMTSVGEETGKLSDMLQNVAVYYEREVEQKTKDLSTIIEPVLMVIVGIAVGFFAISMLTPMYSLMSAF